MSKYHKVVTGETLTSIAKKHNTTIDVIRKANPIINNVNLIQAGWLLHIPDTENTEQNNTAIVDTIKKCVSDINNLSSFRELCRLLGY